MVANDVDDRACCPARVVEIRQAVGQARTQMQQGARRPARHSAISVGRAGSDVLLQNQHRPHAGDIVERGDEVHFRRAGIGETDINAIGDERTQQTFSTVHG